MTRPYPYYPAHDGKAAQPGALELMRLLEKRGWKNLGIYANRPMRNPAANGALSVHATGAALDAGYPDRNTGVRMWDFLIAHSKTLGIVEVHDYAFGKFGRGYRCSRGEGTKGVKVYANAAESAGTGGKWLHVELSPEMAADKDKFRDAWILANKDAGIP